MKKKKKGGKCFSPMNPTSGCGGNKGTKCEIIYIMPFASTKEKELQK